LYIKLCADGKWLGVNQNKATFPTFTSPKAASTFLSKVNCHNCGGPHYLRDCTEPLDQSRIDANKKRVIAAKKVAKSEGTNKSKNDKSKNPPKSSEGHSPGGKFPLKRKKGQLTRCEVEGKSYYCHYKKNKWLPADRQANSSESTYTTTTAGSSKAVHLAEHNLVISNMKNQFADAMSALSASMADRS
jgi:hypothetical protein